MASQPPVPPEAPAPRAASGPDDPYAAMLRGTLVPTSVAALVLVVGNAVREGVSGLAGALVAAAVVLVFFSVSLLVMRATAAKGAAMVMAASLVSYVTKVGLLLLFLVLMRDATWASPTAFAVTAVVCAVVWMAFEVRAFARMRVLVADEPGADPARRSPA